MKYTCVLFDLDGTVLDTTADIHSAVNRTLVEFSYPTHSPEKVASFLNNGAKMLISRALPEDVRENEDIVSRVLSRYIENYTSRCTRSTVVYDGVTELLEKLSASGVSLGIVTNKPHVQTEIVVPYYFGTLFSYFQGSCDELPNKPHEKRVSLALDALGKTREDALFVGDSYVDVLTARSAGIKCIGVDWGFSGKKSFEKASPDKVVSTAADIFDIAKSGF